MAKANKQVFSLFDCFRSRRRGCVFAEGLFSLPEDVSVFDKRELQSFVSR